MDQRKLWPDRSIQPTEAESVKYSKVLQMCVSLALWPFTCCMEIWTSPLSWDKPCLFIDEKFAALQLTEGVKFTFFCNHWFLSKCLWPDKKSNIPLRGSAFKDISNVGYGVGGNNTLAFGKSASSHLWNDTRRELPALSILLGLSFHFSVPFTGKKINFVVILSWDASLLDTF